MKRGPSPELQDRFSGSLRHYHRTVAAPQRSWDDWVEGSKAKRKNGRNWLKVSGVAFGLLALGGIIAGLVIELG